MATVTRIDPPKIPFGYNEKFIDYAGLNLRGKKFLAHVSTDARSEADFLAKGIHIETNRGQPYSTNIPSGEYVYFGDASDQRAATNGSKPFNEYTQPEVNQIVTNITNKYPGGIRVACHEAQENEGPWRYDDNYAPQQIQWLMQAWKAYKDSHPNFLGDYGPYSGSVTPVIFISPNDLAQAFTSNKAAFDLLSRAGVEFYRCHYWTQKHYLYRAPLINMYIHQMSSTHNVMAECTIAVRLHQMALAHVGRDPNDMMVFVWTESASGLDGSYTERYVKKIGDGTLFGHNFPGWDADSMIAISRYGIEHGQVLFNWQDTYLFGRDTNLLPPDVIREDGYQMVGYDRPATRTTYYSNPSPYRPATTSYPFPPQPRGGQDMGPLGAWFHSQGRDIVDAELQPVPWRQNNESFIDTTPSVYWIKTWTEGLAWVEGVRNGNVGLVTIYDVCGKYCVKGVGQMDVNLGGTVVTLNYYRGVMNQFKIEF